MKTTFSLLFFLGILFNAYSQDYDLVVTITGDSIACRIDSTTDASIYFEMKHNNNWIHTSINRNEVIEYKYGVIDKKMVVFKPGTSYILSLMKPVDSILDLPKNSLYVSSHVLTFDAFYERTISINNKPRLLAGGGIMQVVAFGDETNPVGKIGCLLGGYKHFFETGIVIAPLGENVADILVPVAGYRYQNPKGFLFRFDIMLFMDSGTAKDGSGDKWFAVYPIPGIALGYSF